MITAPWFWFSIMTLLFFGITGVTQKLSTNHVSTQLSFLGFAAAFVPLAIATAILFPVDLRVSAGVFLLGAVGGVLNSLGALTSFAAFEAGGKASVVMPIISLYPLVTVIGAWVFLGEQISAAHWVGILLAPLAGWLLSSE